MPPLLGRKLVFHHHDRGQHTGVIRTVQRDRRGNLTGITVQMFNPAADNWRGTRIRLGPGEWSAPWCGVIYRGKVRALTTVNVAAPRGAGDVPGMTRARSGRSGRQEMKRVAIQPQGSGAV